MPGALCAGLFSYHKSYIMKIVNITAEKGYWDGKVKHRKGSVIAVTDKTADQLYRNHIARPEQQGFKAQKVKKTVQTTETWPKNKEVEKKPKKTRGKSDK